VTYLQRYTQHNLLSYASIKNACQGYKWVKYILHRWDKSDMHMFFYWINKSHNRIKWDVIWHIDSMMKKQICIWCKTRSIMY
jgi:hypothetical protein